MKPRRRREEKFVYFRLFLADHPLVFIDPNRVWLVYLSQESAQIPIRAPPRKLTPYPPPPHASHASQKNSIGQTDPTCLVLYRFVYRLVQVDKPGIPTRIPLRQSCSRTSLSQHQVIHQIQRVWCDIKIAVYSKDNNNCI